MLKLSKASKMPCKSWSLQALDTCPASKNVDGTLVDACKGCYATTGNYNFPNVKAPRVHNKEDWKRDEWVADMVQALDTERYFRWFDSGDMYDLRLAQKILEVMQQTPWVKHWLPTRMYKFAKFHAVLRTMNALPNVVVRVSSDSVQGERVHFDGFANSTIVPYTGFNSEATECKAYERDGKCATCRACWDKTVDTVAYVAHGRKMDKVIRLVNVA